MRKLLSNITAVLKKVFLLFNLWIFSTDIIIITLLIADLLRTFTCVTPNWRTELQTPDFFQNLSFRIRLLTGGQQTVHTGKICSWHWSYILELQLTVRSNDMTEDEQKNITRGHKNKQVSPRCWSGQSLRRLFTLPYIVRLAAGKFSGRQGS